MEDVFDDLADLDGKGADLHQSMRDKLIEHKRCIDEHGEDLPEVRNWKWVVIR
jgi:xylulose-5-phosphate/fructose-6-phosphate phosphoketolase